MLLLNLLCEEHKIMFEMIFEENSSNKINLEERVFRYATKLTNCSFFLFILCKVSKLTLHNIFKLLIMLLMYIFHEKFKYRFAIKVKLHKKKKKFKCNIVKIEISKTKS